MKLFAGFTLLAAALVPAANAQSVLEIIAESADHTVLTQAISTSNLEGLGVGGPGEDGAGWTIFAPTDDAFNDLGDDAVAQLLEPQWFYHLSDLLEYHIVPSSVNSSGLSEGMVITMLNKQNTTITSLDPPTINDEAVIAPADLEATNGYVHVTDAILMPAFVTMDIVDAAAATPELSTLVELVGTADLVDTLEGDGPFTVFAPTNEAFAALPAETLEFLTSRPGRDDLVDILTYHVFPGIIHSTRFVNSEIEMVNGDNATIDFGTPSIEGAAISITDILVNNGIVHIIDAVITPPEPSTTAPATMAPATMGPDTMGPDTMAPASMVPGTMAPASMVPGTMAPASMMPDTMVPATMAPVTAVPDTMAPVTAVPDTMAPVAAAPVPAAPVSTAPVSSSLPTVVGIVTGSPDHTVLATAVAAFPAAVEALNGPGVNDGGWTVFAPTDAAFGALGGEVARLLQPQWSFHLTDILYYHIVAASVDSSFLVVDQEITMLNNGTTTITSLDPPSINNATIDPIDLQASNGYVHVTDAVLLPPSATTNIVAAAAATPALSTLVDLVTIAELVETLEGDGPFTVFAPTNDAFDALPAEKLEFLKSPEGKAELTDILTYHVHSSIVHSSTLESGEIEMVNGDEATVDAEAGTIEGATIAMPDILVSNGIVHVIDAVILPPSEEEMTAAPVPAPTPSPVSTPDSSAGILGTGMVALVSAASALFLL